MTQKSAAPGPRFFYLLPGHNRLDIPRHDGQHKPQYRRTFQPVEQSMKQRSIAVVLMMCAVCLLPLSCGSDGDPATDGDSDGDVEDSLPVCYQDRTTGEVIEFVTGLSGSEGIAMDGLGGFYISTDDTVSYVSANGAVTRVADLPKSLGMAFDAAGNMMICASGPTFNKVDRDGTMHLMDSDENISEAVASGVIANPNFVTRTPWGTWLVSDDMLPEIFEITDDGTTSLWSDAVPSPNGMVFSKDGGTLYVASTFEDFSPLYQIAVADGKAGAATILANMDDNGLSDGVAMDRDGNVYVAVNGKGKIVRVTPSGDIRTVAEDMLMPASIAFGEGEGLDPCSIYVTSLIGETVYRIPLGISGMPLFK